MLPRDTIGTAIVPGGVELRLIQHGQDFAIVLDGNELMSSRLGGSEEALATKSIERLKGRQALHILIGGYGMGFTLRAALAALDKDAKVTVAELTPEIITWARGPMAAMTGSALEDSRVDLVIGDVGALIAPARAKYDAILLDVDNGPDGLSREDNGRIYSLNGLSQAQAALKPGGVLAVWSAGPNAAFATRLRHVGYKVDEEIVRARSNGKGPRHVIWFATRA